MNTRSRGGGSLGKRSKKTDPAKASLHKSRAHPPSAARADGGSQSQALELPVVRRFLSGYRWEGIPMEPYKLRTHRGGEFRGASRQVLIGRGGEHVRFHVRYFEIARGGFTSFERHCHSHVVIGVRGRGSVRVGGKYYSIGRMDTVYIAPGQPHQLATAGRSAFGFLCIVDARRDRPRPVTE